MRRACRHARRLAERLRARWGGRRVRLPRDSSRCGAEAGFASVLVLTLAVVLAAFGATVTSLASVAVARQRAASAADLAALAAADASLSGAASACSRAAEVADRVAATLQSCALDGDVADVVVSVRPPGPIGRLGEAAVRARAGPTSLSG